MQPPETLHEFYARDHALLNAGRETILTLKQSYEGVFVCGSTGAGKTSTSIRFLTERVLVLGAGGLLLTIKPEDAEDYTKWAANAGRSASVARMTPGGAFRCNLLDYLHQAGADTEQLCQFLIELCGVSERASGQGEGQSFWDNELRKLLRNALDLNRLAGKRVSLDALSQIISSAPESLDALHGEAFRAGFCFQALQAAHERRRAGALNTGDARALEMAERYWLREFPALAPNTKSCVIASFTGMADPFLRGALYELFGTTTTITPDDILRGLIVVLNMPIKKHGASGRLAACALKLAFQFAVARRDLSANPRPVLLLADEAQYTFLPKHDAMFQATDARRGRVIHLSAIQNLPLLYAEFGAQAEHLANGLLGNFQTKIFHQQSCPITQEWSAKIIGRTLQHKSSVSANWQERPNADAAGGSHGMSATREEQWQIMPHVFSTLKKGGAQHKYIVSAILYQGGRRFASSQKNYVGVTFKQ